MKLLFLTVFFPLLTAWTDLDELDSDCKGLCYNFLVDLKDYITADQNEDLTKQLLDKCEDRLFDLLDHSVIVRRCPQFCKKTAPVVANDKELREKLKSADWEKTVSDYCKEYACKPCEKLHYMLETFPKILRESSCPR